jgi:glucokinase
VHSSEGGHATFAPETARERKLAAHLAKRLKRVSTERVVSGPGLAAAYESLSGKAIEPAAVSKLALARKDPDAVEALDIFVAAFGAAAGNLALTVLSTGGVYLAGGIAPAILEKLRDGTFMDAFRQKGRLSPLLGRMPVHVILSPVAGLLGAAVVAAGL